MIDKKITMIEILKRFLYNIDIKQALVLCSLLNILMKERIKKWLRQQQKRVVVKW